MAFKESETLLGKPTPYRTNVDLYVAERVWQEIQEGLRTMVNVEDKPDIVLIPELHLPINKIEAIKAISRKHNFMIISGVDFQRNPTNSSKIRNRGIVTIPSDWGSEGSSRHVSALHFGKTYFTYMERALFKNVEGAICKEDPESNMYIFESKQFGSFGIMICSDIFDIERMMLYQGRIQHLFIISLNKDLTTYFAMAESLTRLLYCNVVICNTGFFGGSLAVSPYREPSRRTIYQYQGQQMLNTNIISIPLDSLIEAQFTDYTIEKERRPFKASPPGYYDKIHSIKSIAKMEKVVPVP